MTVNYDCYLSMHLKVEEVYIQHGEKQSFLWMIITSMCSVRESNRLVDKPTVSR